MSVNDIIDELEDYCRRLERERDSAWFWERHYENKLSECSKAYRHALQTVLLLEKQLEEQEKRGNDVY